MLGIVNRPSCSPHLARCRQMVDGQKGSTPRGRARTQPSWRGRTCTSSRQNLGSTAHSIFLGEVIRRSFGSYIDLAAVLEPTSCSSIWMRSAHCEATSVMGSAAQRARFVGHTKQMAYINLLLFLLGLQPQNDLQDREASGRCVL